MADLVQVEGHPAELSEAARRRASRAALLSAVAIGASLALNLLGIFVVLALTAR